MSATRRLLMTVAFAFLALGCSQEEIETAKKEVHPVAKRAPFDLNCAPEQVGYLPIDSSTIGARGCGRQTTYVKACREKVSSSYNPLLPGPDVKSHSICQWQMDGAGVTSVPN